MDHLERRGLRVYALDFLGYGLSDRYPGMADPSGPPVGRAVDVVHDLAAAVDAIRAHSGHDRVILIGHSWGATVAALYAEQHPTRVERLVLYAAITPRPPATAAQPVTRSTDEMEAHERVRQMDQLTPPGAPRRLAPEVFAYWADAWLQSDRTHGRTGSNMVRWPAGPAADVQDLLQGKAYFAPERIKAPVLIVRGSDDAYPNDEDARALAYKMGAAARVAYRVLPGGSHVMHLERGRQRLYRAVDDFID